MKPINPLLILLLSILSISFVNAKEYKVTIRGEALKIASLISESGIRTSVSGIQEIIAEKPEQIVLELQQLLPFEGTGLNQTVILNEVSILSSDAKVVAGSKETDHDITTSLPIYRGKISDSESINLCFTPRGIVGNFHIADKDYCLNPDESEQTQSNSPSHFLEAIKKPGCGDDWCKTDLSHIPDEITELMAKSDEPQLKSAQAQLIAKVAIETDYETYEGFGKDSVKTAAWLLSVIAKTSQIFEQEVNVKLEVGYLKVWTTPDDPYIQKGYALMTDFYEYLKNNIRDVKRDVAILVIKDPARLSGGQGELDQLGNLDLSFLIAGEYAVTHELGHVFGSPHTHDCRWPAGPNGTLAPIDKCAHEVYSNCPATELISQEGTIMSYCGTFKPVFGPFVQHLIRARAEVKLGKIAPHTHEVRGKVINNGIGLSGVVITFYTWFSGENYNTTTDATGNYTINLPDNLYSYEASKESYLITPLGPKGASLKQGQLYVSEININNIDFDALDLLEVKPDMFEPDNTPDLAIEIKTDGSVQTRTVHKPWDFDFFKFQAEAGKTYTIVVKSLSFNLTGFDLIDRDGLNPVASTTWKIEETTQALIWKAETSGQYYIKAGQGGEISKYDISIHNAFAEVNSGISGCFSKNVEWGDFDQDGDLDLLLSDYLGSNNYFLYTNSNDNFTVIEKNIVHPEYGGRSTMKWADLDNDGDLDIVVGNMYGINVYYNNQGKFSERKLLADYVGHPISHIDPGDFDNDGDIDILFPSSLDKKIHILKNENGVFTNTSTGMPGFYSGKTNWIDFDNDGDLDIIVAGSLDGGSFGEPFVRIFKNENGKFYDNGPKLDQITGEPNFAFGDFDLDGDADLVLAGSLNGKLVTQIYRNNLGNFEKINSNLTGLWHASLDWGDFDNDGDVDLIMSGSPKLGNANSNTVLIENKSGFFDESRLTLTLLKIVGTSNWCDTDGDNALDLLLVGQTWNGDKVSLMKNENSIKNLPPNPPTDLNVQPREMNTIFSWSSSTDDRTPSSGLTYNLRIGTSPGKADVLSPNSNIETGKRLIVNTGNCGYLLAKTIHNLKPGTYYWSVQAIDNSYVGSAWAPEQTFTIKSSNIPIANAGIDQTVNEGSMVTLDGSLSSDADQDNLTYKWTAPIGITFNSATVAKPTFTAPEVKEDSTLVFTLVLNDGIVDSSPATVKVLVKNVLTVGVNDEIDSGFAMYPNPTTGVVIIGTDETTSDYCEVTVYNSTGTLVNVIRAEISNEIKIDLSDLVPGSYLLKVSIGNKLQTKMLIKQ